MMHSTSGKRGYEPYVREPFILEAHDVISRDEMREILLAEERLRAGAEYQAAIDGTGYDLAKLSAVTREVQLRALREVLGEARVPPGDRDGAGSDATADVLLGQLHGARQKYRGDPTMNQITVYQRHDRSRAGSLRVGHAAPDVSVVDAATGLPRQLLSFMQSRGGGSASTKPLVLLCGSLS